MNISTPDTRRAAQHHERVVALITIAVLAGVAVAVYGALLGPFTLGPSGVVAWTAAATVLAGTAAQHLQRPDRPPRRRPGAHPWRVPILAGYLILVAVALASSCGAQAPA